MGGFPFFKKFDGCGCKKEKEACCITAVRACKIKSGGCGDGWWGDC